LRTRPAERGTEVEGARSGRRRLARGRHPGERDTDPDRHQHESHADVGRHHGVELGRLHDPQLFGRHRRPVFGGRRVQVRQDQRGGQEHAEIGADRIESLGEVQPPGRVRLRPHRDRERVGRGLQDRQAGREGEQRGEEIAVDHRLAGRVEHEGTDRGQAEPGQHPDFVRVTSIDEGGGQRQTKIRPIVAELHQRRLQGAHAEDFAEHLDQRIGHVGRHAPGGEAGHQQGERNNHFPIHEWLFLLHLACPSLVASD
jgi:hypothetical protein